ncbi:hypothetical protein [Plantactinospora sp. BB1]|uniref:DUF7919 family protein n=1 Tax=Plantactinospora sp. BB1 TaxID=2071627 RepID=UPI000D16B5AC|nr:hypothetical protein [Plantactinospora sp. BB1]AVT38709.1 hypothetical protein C6W10_22260 [Plantactinospora sp. BB1]
MTALGRWLDCSGNRTYQPDDPGDPSGSGVMFAAPSLIWHYVTAHSYRPPTEFIEAVQQYDPGWISEASPWIPDDATRITFD